MKDFKEANEKQVNNFKRIYCKSEKKLLSLIKNKDFKITPISINEICQPHLL